MKTAILPVDPTPLIEAPERMLAALVNGPFLITDRGGRISDINDAAAALAATKPRALVGKSVAVLFRFDPAWEELVDVMAKVAAGEARAQVATSAAGHEIDWSLRRTAEGAVVLVGHDVTSRMEELHLLRRTVQRQNAILDHMTDLAWMSDVNSRLLMVNRALSTFAEVPADEMTGNTTAEYFPPEIAEMCLASDAEVMETGRTYRRTEKIIDSRGTARWIETIKNPVFDESGVLIGVTGIARDVSAEQAADAQRQDTLRRLADEHQRLADIIQNVPGVVCEEWFDGSSRYVSSGIQEMLGYSPEEYLAMFSTFLEIVHPDDRDTVSEAMREMIATRTGGALKFRAVRHDGILLWCESRCSLIIDSHGRVAGIRGVSIDITERERDHCALRRSEERFRDLVNTAPAMLWIADTKGSVSLVSRRFLDFLGKSAEEIMENGWLSGVHPSDLEKVMTAVTEAVMKRGPLHYEMRYTRGEGEYRDLMVDGVPRFADDGTYLGLVGNAIDLTELRGLERRLEQSRRLSSLGRLAATIAHEINNVLMGVQPFADVLSRTESAEVIKDAVVQIKRSVERGRRITHEILRFANTASPQAEPLALQEWFREHLPELLAIAGESICFETEIEDPLHIVADPAQLQQVFTNLVANARDAMRGGGTIQISAARDRRRTDLAHIVITDTGCGIPADALSHVFEPLYTTKPTGTGLGLALAYDIIEKHGGEITVESIPGSGTTFQIFLPATDARSASAPVGGAMPKPQIRRIVVVEDDPVVSRGLALLLEMDGIEVAVAETAHEAVPLIRSYAPDLVVLDVGLPDVPGTDAFAWIRQTNPDLPILFSTGHGREVELEEFLVQPHTGYLLKPYGGADLLTAITAITAITN